MRCFCSGSVPGSVTERHLVSVPSEADPLLPVEKHSAGVMSAFTAGGRQAAVSSHWLKKTKNRKHRTNVSSNHIASLKFAAWPDGRDIMVRDGICIVGILVFCSEIGQFC